MKLLVHIWLAKAVVLVLFVACTTVHDDFDSKDALLELLTRNEWRLDLYNEADEKVLGPSGYNLLFKKLSGELHISDIKTIGRWSLFYADEVVWYDDIDGPAPDMSDELYFEDLEEEELFLSIYINHPAIGRINNTWEVVVFSSSSIKMQYRNGELILILKEVSNDQGNSQ